MAPGGKCLFIKAFGEVYQFMKSTPRAQENNLLDMREFRDTLYTKPMHVNQFVEELLNVHRHLW